jgi:hypothetical protein
VTIFREEARAVARFKEQFAANERIGPILCKMSPQFIFQKLLAAEDTVAQRLRVFLEPTQVLCSDDPDTVNAPLIAAAEALTPPMPIHYEPGYPYNPDFFRDNSWGMLQTRQVRINLVQAWSFYYFDPRIPVFTVPLDWVKADKKYGRLQLLPTGEAVLLPLNAYLLSVFGGGRSIPNMIHIQYIAGIKDIWKEHPGLVDFVFRIAALLMILDQFPAGSESISMDGLTQSQAFDISAYIDGTKGSIEREYKTWTDRIHGIRMLTC